MARTAKKVVTPQQTATAFHSELLDRLVKGRQSNDAFYEYHPANVTAQLVADGLVDVNEAMQDENGYLATRASDKAMQDAPSATVHPFAPAESFLSYVAKHGEVSQLKYAIDDGIALPPVKRNFGSTREPTYPFDLLNVGQSFHVPATEDMPNPSRALGSAVSQQNKKWARGTGRFETVEVQLYKLGADGKRLKHDGHYVKDGVNVQDQEITVQEREFTIRTVDASDPRGSGARVFRIK